MTWVSQNVLKVLFRSGYFSTDARCAVLQLPRKVTGRYTVLLPESEKMFFDLLQCAVYNFHHFITCSKADWSEKHVSTSQESVRDRTDFCQTLIISGYNAISHLQNY